MELLLISSVSVVRRREGTGVAVAATGEECGAAERQHLALRRSGGKTNLFKAQRPERSTIERRVLQGHAAEGGYLGFPPFILPDAVLPT
jgi:hypothetical protein